MVERSPGNHSPSDSAAQQPLTTALATLVIPVVQGNASSIKQGTLPNTLIFLATNHAVSIPIAVLDNTRLHVLKIIVALPGISNSLSVSNTLNRNGVGKWLVDGDGDLAYVLELPYTRRTRSACFAHALILALGSVLRAFRAKRRRQHRSIKRRKESDRAS